jgi:hypothetical protein
MSNVAFLITVYAGDQLSFFKKAISSIYTQEFGFQNINIYLGVDGEVSDEISTYINANSFLFFKVSYNTANKGLAYTLNKLIGLLEGETYIFRMDSDDISYPSRVRCQYNYMEKNKNIQILGGAIREVGSRDFICNVKTYPANNSEARKFIFKAAIFAHPTICFRKSFFNEGFRYNENIFQAQDAELWFRVINQDINMANLNTVVLDFRVSDEFFNRRNYKRSIEEFAIFWNGTILLYGYSYRLLYPMARLLLRLLPKLIVKRLYKSNLRNNF